MHRDKHTDRQTHRQTDTQTDIQTDRPTDRQTDRQTDRHETDRQSAVVRRREHQSGGAAVLANGSRQQPAPRDVTGCVMECSAVSRSAPPL